jgi:transposase
MERAQLERYVSEGLSLEQMGGRLGKHPTTVAYWLKKHGLRATHSDRYAPKGGLPRASLEPLVAEGMTLEQMAKRLEVSITTVRYWLGRHELATAYSTRVRMLPDERPAKITRECRHHGLATFARTGSAGYYRCMKCRAEAVVARRRAIKQILVSEAGGACRLCGYDRHLGALEFHHLDPSYKEFNIARRGISRSIQRARAEAHKCVLLCSNCHAEVEGGIVQLDPDIRRSGVAQLAERDPVKVTVAGSSPAPGASSE